jgi:two-component system response regulator (stage 0 sporulation protein A)
MLLSKIIKNLGVSPALLGYGYIKYAVELMFTDETYMYSITKKLYPKIAIKYNTTADRVERAIRHAIETGWIKGSEVLQKDLFGYSISSDKGKPTNSEFLTTVADYLRMLVGDNNE